MPFHNLQSFLAFLETKGDLLRITAEVDPVLEISEIAIRTVQRDGPALLFENVKGSKFPLLINVLGSMRRVNWALGRTPAQVGEELAHFAESLMPPSPAAVARQWPTVRRILAMGPKNVSAAPVKRHVIEPADLGQLPIAQSWPDDGGKFITFPLVLTRGPNDGKTNVGVYRMHVYNRNETGMHWQIGKGGGYHYQVAEAKGEALPVAVVLGADPILMMCGVLPLPENLSEIAFAGFLRGAATRMTRIGPRPISVPAEAEFILEGAVPPNERRREGPYGDHFGHYSLAADFPVFKIDRIWHRPSPVFPIAVVGKPPQEDQVIGDAVQEMLLPLLKIMHPEIVDLWAYMEAGFHNLLVASVKQRFAKEAIKTGLWALGEGQLALTKVVVLVDPEVNARKFTDVLKAIRDHFQPSNDFLLLSATSQDTLDFTSGKMNLGSKMIIDATRKSDTRGMGGRGALTSAPARGRVDLDAVRRVDPRIRDVRVLEDALLVVQVDQAGATGGREILEKMVHLPSIAAVPLVAAVSPDVPLDDLVLLPWGLFTRFDCARDTFFQSVELKGGHPVYRGPLFIDATWKPGYPDPLVMTDEIVKRVDRRWNEYGFK
jgi:4-hydroxy-3-polyprenylbenzoate decarboxylase